MVMCERQLSAAIPELRKSQGNVIFTSSDAGEKPTFAAWGAYGATKAAVSYIVKVLALEEPQITPVAVYPGVVNTPLVKGIFAGDCEWHPTSSQQRIQASRPSN
jgi:NAD(P)-dependent dehydrogenase (short-subunit alcohol dehydrogenase family)